MHTLEPPARTRTRRRQPRRPRPFGRTARRPTGCSRSSRTTGGERSRRRARAGGTESKRRSKARRKDAGSRCREAVEWSATGIKRVGRLRHGRRRGELRLGPTIGSALKKKEVDAGKMKFGRWDTESTPESLRPGSFDGFAGFAARPRGLRREVDDVLLLSACGHRPPLGARRLCRRPGITDRRRPRKFRRRAKLGIFSVAANYRPGEEAEVPSERGTGRRGKPAMGVRGRQELDGRPDGSS
jgi:hypothetical protein